MWRGTGPVQTSGAAKGAGVDFNEAQAVVESVLSFRLRHRPPVLAPRQGRDMRPACSRGWMSLPVETFSQMVLLEYTQSSIRHRKEGSKNLFRP